MNKKNILNTAKVLENAHAFDPSKWTTGIAGNALWLRYFESGYQLGFGKYCNELNDASKAVRQFLGINNYEATKLFVTDPLLSIFVHIVMTSDRGGIVNLDDMYPEWLTTLPRAFDGQILGTEAAEVLRNFADTGEIDWAKALDIDIEKEIQKYESYQY